MTDRTHPDSGRATGAAHIIRYALELGLLWVDGDGRDKVREAFDALDTLESQLEAIGAGGVSGPLVGRTSISANAGEPRALNPRHIRKFLQALQAGEMSVSRAVEILDAWVGGYYEDEMVPLPPPDSCLIADDEFPMEIVRKLRSELAATPPTAQAEGWRLVPVEPTKEMLLAGSSDLRLGDCIGTLVRAAECWKAMLAASPTPPAEQPIGELVVTKTKDGQIVSVTRQDYEGRILSVIATSDPEEQQAATTGAALGGVYAELPKPSLPRGGFPDLFTEWQMRDFADRTHALRMEQAAPKAAPAEVLGWIYEDELPESYPYSAMFPHSKVDTVRMFPVFGPTAAPGERRNTKTHDLLSTMIGLFLGHKQAIGYKPGSVIDKVVNEAVEHLKDWPYPEAAPQQEAQEPSRSAKTWCSYVAGMIGCYLNEPDESTKVQAIAGIIERRLWALPTPQQAPAPLSRDQIREVFMAHGFTVKEGQTDLKQYVYDAAYALLGTKPAPLSDDTALLDGLARLNWYVGPGDFYCDEAGGMNDYDDKNSSPEELRQAIRAALAAQGDKP